jgi:hypothetical protein
MKRSVLKLGVVSLLVCVAFVFCFSVGSSSAKTIKIAFLGPSDRPECGPGQWSEERL